MKGSGVQGIDALLARSRLNVVDGTVEPGMSLHRRKLISWLSKEGHFACRWLTLIKRIVTPITVQPADLRA